MCDMLKRLFFSFLCFYVALTSKTVATLRNSWIIGGGGDASHTCDRKIARQYKFGQASLNTAVESDQYVMTSYAERNLNE